MVFTSPRTSPGHADQAYEMVPSGPISNPSEGGRESQREKPPGIAVKGERHPTVKPRP